MRVGRRRKQGVIGASFTPSLDARKRGSGAADSYPLSSPVRFSENMQSLEFET